MRCSVSIVGAIVGLVGVAGSAQAGLMTQTGTIPLRVTDWNETIMLDQFDLADGQRALVSVGWTVAATVIGSVEIESLDADTTMIGANLGATLSLDLGGHDLGDVEPMITQNFMATPFDGVIDFAGTSGATFGPLIQDVIASGTIFDATNFIGSGLVPLQVGAIGAAWASGSGNVITSFTTEARLTYEIVYQFTEVPAPGPVALCALAGATALSSRRRVRAAE